MEAWIYLTVLVSLLVPFFIAANVQTLRGIFGWFRLKRLIGKQPLHIRGFTFDADGEDVYIDFVTVCERGIFAVFSHDIAGKLAGKAGRTYFTAERRGEKIRFFNPLPQDIRAVNLLNKKVPEYADITPVLVFPRGNGGNIDCMWVEDVSSLPYVFGEQAEEPLSRSRMNEIFSALDCINLDGKRRARAKRASREFISRRCPVCGGRLRDADENGAKHVECARCNFVRRYPAAFDGR